MEVEIVCECVRECLWWCVLCLQGRCRSRTARNRTRASMSVWQWTAQEHATPLLPTSTSEVRSATKSKSPSRFTSICFHTGFTTARTGPGAQKLTFLLNHTVVLIETRSCGGELLHCFPMLNNHEMFPHRCSKWIFNWWLFYFVLCFK